MLVTSSRRFCMFFFSLTLCIQANRKQVQSLWYILHLKKSKETTLEFQSSVTCLCIILFLWALHKMSWLELRIIFQLGKSSLFIQWHCNLLPFTNSFYFLPGLSGITRMLLWVSSFPSLNFLTTLEEFSAIPSFDWFWMMCVTTSLLHELCQLWKANKQNVKSIVGFLRHSAANYHVALFSSGKWCLNYIPFLQILYFFQRHTLWQKEDCNSCMWFKG